MHSTQSLHVSSPPSHQPRRSNADEDYIPTRQEAEESISEADAPDMTEEAPPPSSYQVQHRLALQNNGLMRGTTARKPRTLWSAAEEDAFIEYMNLYPAKYARILEYDRTEGHGVLQNRTQVNLKDKARTMAVNMIKSRTAPLPGFEDIVKPTSREGRMLLENGFEW